MNKNIKLSIIASGVIAVLAVGGIGYRVDQLQKKRDYFQDKFTKTKSMLPQAIIIDKTSESSLFSTESTYTVSIKQKGNTSPSKLIINTHLNHGFSYLFSGVIEGTSVGKIVGPFTQEFKSLDKLFDSTIKVLSDDTLITDTKFVDLIAKDGSQFNGITSYFQTTKDDDLITTHFKIASMNSPILPDGKSIFNLKGFDLQYNGKSNNLGNNHFSVTLGEVKSPFAQVNNISLIADSKVKSGLVDLTSSLSIGKINANQWKNGSIEFTYSLLGLDQHAIETIYTIGKKTAPTNKDDIEKNIIAMEKQIQKLFTRGFSAHVDKLAFKSGDDTFNLSLKSSLPSSKTFEEVSIENNFNIIYHLDTKGSLSTPLADFLNAKLQSLVIPPSDTVEPIELVKVNNNTLNVDFEVKQGKGILNGIPFTTDQNDMLHIIFSTFDERLHSTTSLSHTNDNIIDTTNNTNTNTEDDKKNSIDNNAQFIEKK